MSYNLVDSTTGALTRVAGGGGTFYADLPIGSWIKNNMDTLPSGFLKEGDAISQSECPELYAKYGSTVPYKADTSELDSYSTNVAYSTLTSSSGYKMLYDGFMEIRMQGASGQAGPTATLTVNNSTAMQCGNYQDGSRRTQLFFFRKGDVLKITNGNSSAFECKIAYYKKSLIVKAKHAAIPADFIDAVAEMNGYSTTETLTGGTWIDGKPIYRKVYAVTSGVTLYEEHWLDSSYGVPQADISSWSKIVSGMYVGTNKSSYPMNFYYGESHVFTNVLNSNRQVSSVSGDYIVIEYTKTTD